MNEKYLDELLQALEEGRLSREVVLAELKDLPYRDIGIAHLDTHRGLRDRLGEVVFAAGKTTSQLETILRHLLTMPGNILVTRLDDRQAAALQPLFPQFTYDEVGRCLVCRRREIEPAGRGTVLVVTAGTSDLPVAREAVITLELLGQPVELLADVGVAGLHRLLAYREQLWRAAVIVAVAGMEGALPSVIAGLVDRPVIAVPTSVGYGAAFGGVAALLGMLNTCASGVGVVNIDNGFGAACLAALINRAD
ncbi:MAG: nickel pincer cofactor biosynthesis protein LarB [Deltaproteobacteria bacterium]|nr:nickel pincer cofactor biosynthesis protein LarB [Deltaproteobacteria bacterium]